MSGATPSSSHATLPTVRVGVIGGGIWGGHHMRAAREFEHDGKAMLVAVATRSPESAAKNAAAFGITGYTDYRKMIAEEQLDAVTVATPDHLHREMVLHALDRGLHVLVEKPMDTTVNGCEDMVQRAESRGRLLQVDFHKRYDPYVIDVRQCVAAGGIGAPQYAYAYMEDQIVVPADWLKGWAAESSPFWFLGVHQYDLLRWVTGRDAVSVLAYGRKDKLAGIGIDTYDSVTAQVRFERGMTATIDTSWALPRAMDAVVNQGLRIVGGDGVIEFDAKDRGLRYYLAEGGITTPNPNALQDQAGPRGPQTTGYFLAAVKDFFENVRFVGGGGDLAALTGHYPGARDGLKATQLCEAVDASLRKGVAVEVT